MIGMDDSKSNRDIVEMIKKISLAIKKKNVDDLRAIALELQRWEPPEGWSELDVRTKVFVEHVLVGLARIQFGLEVLDKGADELTEIRQEMENKEMYDAILDSFDEEDYADYKRSSLDKWVSAKDLADGKRQKFTCERCGILKGRSAPGVSNYKEVDGHKICGWCYRGFKHWMERVKDCKAPDFQQRPSRKNKKSKNLKEYWDKREAYRDEIFRKLEEMKRHQDHKYVDEAEWWLDNRYRTDKQHYDKKDLADDEKEDLK